MTAKTRATLLSEAAANITDALTGQNSAADVRTRLEDLADSAIIQEAWEGVASAATCAIGASSSNFVNITGTTPITSFGTIGAGILRFLKFAGILTLTHNATSLILPGGANITTVAGDRAIAVSEGASNWRVLAYLKASGKAVIGPAAADITDFAQGVYTPTLTGVTNVAASGSPSGMYTRFGAQVIVALQFTLDPTAAALTTLRVSLPVASDLGAGTLFGSASSLTESGRFTADAANNDAQLDFTAVSLLNQSWFGTFMYRVI